MRFVLIQKKKFNLFQISSHGLARSNKAEAVSNAHLYALPLTSSQQEFKIHMGFAFHLRIIVSEFRVAIYLH